MKKSFTRRQLIGTTMLSVPMLIALHEGACAAPTLKAVGGGQVRALVIGINQYASDSLPSLKGAEADAADFVATLKKLGVTDLTDFIGPRASRSAVEGAIKGLIARTRAGDLVIITFAGHGLQAKT